MALVDRMKRFNGRLLLWQVCMVSLCWVSAAGSSGSVQVSAGVQHERMALGQNNTYTITLRNLSSVPPMDPPAVAGLVFGSNMSTSSRTSIVQGVQSAEISLSWTFQAEREGRFTIPARTLQVRGETIRIPAVELEVTEMPRELREQFFLSWEVPRGPYFVGQAIPATLQLYVRSGLNARLGSHPDGSSDQFIRTPFSGEPQQTEVRVDGRPYLRVDWETMITPIRSGTGSLPIGLVLVYNTGQFQRDFWGSRAVQDQIRLSTGAEEWVVRDLPRRDRPASFSGAVGQFDASASLSRRELEIGEPLTVTLKVSGEGNFERIQPPEFQSSDHWRTYPPRARMSEQDVPWKGTKTFEYILTPQSELATEVPSIAFSWFDPQNEAWREIIIDPEPVTVLPRPSVAEAAPSPGVATQVDNDRSTVTMPSIAMRLERRGNHGIPFGEPVFIAVNGLAGLVFAVALIAVIRRERHLRNPYLQARDQATRQARNIARQAVERARSKDAAGFYRLARQALRHFVGILDTQNRNAESLTGEDLRSIIEDQGFSTGQIGIFQRIFDRKDAVQFAGWQPTDDELAHDCDNFEQLLNEIVRQKRKEVPR